MRLQLLGVRGSTPAPGEQFVRYGGHTSCIAVARDAAAVPDLVLDAGTGLRDLSAVLGGRPFRGAILLSHLHWDHLQGIPFFASGDDDGSHVEVYLPDQAGRSGSDLLAGMMSPPYFPIGPGELRGDWTFAALPLGPSVVAGYTVIAGQVNHKGGRTHGYRIQTPTASVAYLPDHVAGPDGDDAAGELVRGVDVLIHDAQFVAGEEATAAAYGHSTVDQAIALAARAGVGRLVLFHHGPGRTDAQLDEIAAGVAAPLPVTLARQGQIIDVPSAAAPDRPAHSAA